MSLSMLRPVAAEVLETSAWVQAHSAVLGVARERAGLEGREGVCLLRARREAVHRHLGYGAFAEYTDRFLGYNPRTTEDKLRTAEALEHLPELARAQRDGRLNASAVRELARVATAETESEWINAAAGQRVREVERLVAGRAPGDRPTDAQRPERLKHVLRFEVSAETLAAFREAKRRVAEQSGQHLGDDDALLLMARAVLDVPLGAAHETDGTAAPGAEGSDRTDDTHVGIDVGSPPRMAAGPESARAFPDADTRPRRKTSAIPPALRRRVLARDNGCCQIPGCRNRLGIEVLHIQPRADGGPHHPSNTICLCSVHHRAVHAGQLLVSGSASALRVCHADGTRYGGPVSAARSDISEKVFRGLRWLGYREREARAAIAAALHDTATSAELAHDESELLRRALTHLG